MLTTKKPRTAARFYRGGAGPGKERHRNCYCWAWPAFGGPFPVAFAAMLLLPLRSDRSRGLVEASSDDRTARSQDRDVNKSNRLSPSMPRAKSRNMEGPKVKWRRNEALL